MKFSKPLLLAAAVMLAAMPALAQAPEKKELKLGVGGASSLYYLPLAIANQRGYFKEQGLAIEVQDFAGGARSLQALVGGSVDVVTGAYEHTLRMQSKGQDTVAVIELGRYPAITVGVKKEKADKIKSAADLKGAKVGVTAPGSSTNMLVWYLMSKAGLKPDDASYIGVGTGPSAVAAIQKGEIDVISNIEPVISKLESSKDIVVLAETRTAEGTNKVLGGPMPAGVVYLRREFIDKNPNTVQALVNAFYKAIKWIGEATPEQIADSVPQEYWLGDKPLYIAAVKASQEAYSRDGKVDADGQRRTLAFLAQFEAEFKDPKIEPAKTWDGRFLQKAAAAVK